MHRDWWENALTGPVLSIQYKTNDCKRCWLKAKFSFPMTFLLNEMRFRPKKWSAISLLSLQDWIWTWVIPTFFVFLRFFSCAQFLVWLSSDLFDGLTRRWKMPHYDAWFLSLPWLFFHQLTSPPSNQLPGVGPPLHDQSLISLYLSFLSFLLSCFFFLFSFFLFNTLNCVFNIRKPWRYFTLVRPFITVATWLRVENATANFFACLYTGLYICNIDK